MLAPSWETVAASATGGFGIGVGFFFVRWLMIFASGRWDKREAQLDAGTKLLIEQLTAQVKGLFERLGQVEADLAECKEQHASSRAEVMELRAQMQGYGDARQQAALIVAADRAADKKGGPRE